PYVCLRIAMFLILLSCSFLFLVLFYFAVLFFFFFQAEDGIRDATVTGVQTCALPILLPGCVLSQTGVATHPGSSLQENGLLAIRSEERRVGKECRDRWWQYQSKKKKRRKVKYDMKKGNARRREHTER